MKTTGLKTWEEKRKTGFLRYVLTVGVVAYGVPMSIITSFIVNRPFADGVTFKHAFLHVATWLLAGLLFGAIMWCMNERKYKKDRRNTR